MRPFSIGMRHDGVAIQLLQHRYNNCKNIKYQETSPRVRCVWPQQQGYQCRCQTVAVQQPIIAVKQQRKITTQASSSSSALSPDENLTFKDNQSRDIIALGLMVVLMFFAQALYNGSLLEAWQAFSKSFKQVLWSGYTTFFVSALLAAQHGSLTVFPLTMIALTTKAIICVAFGIIYPEAPIQFLLMTRIANYRFAILSVIMMGTYGLRVLWDTFKAQQRPDEGEGSGNLQGAQDIVQGVQQEVKIKDREIKWVDKAQICGIVYLIDWTSVSTFLTVGLAINYHPIGVRLGGMAGHAITSAIAVLVGSFVSKQMSERRIGIISGFSFLLLAFYFGCAFVADFSRYG